MQCTAIFFKCIVGNKARTKNRCRCKRPFERNQTFFLTLKRRNQLEIFTAQRNFDCVTDQMSYVIFDVQYSFSLFRKRVGVVDT